MHPVKRIEIFATSFELSKILEKLDQSDVPGYSIMRNVASKGSAGSVAGDMAMTNLDNVYILVFCLPDQVKPVLEKVKPVLNKFGGACFVSDAVEVRSLRCVASL